MANASGPITALHVPAGQVFAAKANASYSVNGTQLSYRKGSLEGSKSLLYYLGSGTHGRGFIFEEQGQLFQSPVAYFGEARGWDVAPGYENETSVFLSRKVEPACLACHSSGPKFAEGTVSCERCHGPGESHVEAIRASGKIGVIVNPAKLAPEQRDSVCAQCHLTGETRVFKPGRSEATYRPGDLLADHVVPFVWANPDQAEFKVVGHFEGLWQSKCKRVSGDKLSCLTCHDPHVQVPAFEKAAYYRAKCLGCHEQTACKVKAGSCVSCHMPTRATTDGQHTAFTDHAIRRLPLADQKSTHSPELVAFWPARTTERDYALADADTGNWQKAREELLRVASPDAAAASQLAYTYDMTGEPAKAEPLYESALKADPNNLVALTNFGIHLARRGKLAQAAELWKRALAINPGLVPPALNLARIEWRLDQHAEAIATVRNVLSLNPDSVPALALLKDLEAVR